MVQQLPKQTLLLRALPGSCHFNYLGDGEILLCSGESSVQRDRYLCALRARKQTERCPGEAVTSYKELAGRYL